MTLEDALRIARDLGQLVAMNSHQNGVPAEFLLAFARQVEAETIERCAKVCDRHVVRATDWDSSYYDQASEQCAISIRALSSPPAEQGPKEEPGKSQRLAAHLAERDAFLAEDCPDCVGAQPATECECCKNHDGRTPTHLAGLCMLCGHPNED